MIREKLEVIRDGRDFVIKDKKREYVLEVDYSEVKHLGIVRIVYPSKLSGYYNSHVKGTTMRVTGRSIWEYGLKKQDVDLWTNSNLQVLEAGTGLGELVPRLVKQGIRKKPIAIDVVNYEVIAELLQEALKFSESNRVSKRIETLLNRCNILLDAGKVDLVPLPFSKALKTPRLNGVADVVIEHFGPGFYGRLIGAHNYEESIKLLEKFKKQDGKIVTRLYGVDRADAFKL